MDKRFRTIPDPLWEKLKLLIPPEPPKPRGGRPRVDDRVVMSGIVYRLRTGCQWRAIPREFGSGQTCHRRFQQWERAGIFEKLFVCMLHYYDHRRGIQWQWGALDSAIVKAPKGGTSPDRTQRTARSAGRSAMSSRTGVAYR
jgi:transposase